VLAPAPVLVAWDRPAAVVALAVVVVAVVEVEVEAAYPAKEGPALAAQKTRQETLVRK
jgi:hypothetical protein